MTSVIIILIGLEETSSVRKKIVPKRIDATASRYRKEVARKLLARNFVKRPKTKRQKNSENSIKRATLRKKMATLRKKTEKERKYLKRGTKVPKHSTRKWKLIGSKEATAK